MKLGKHTLKFLVGVSIVIAIYFLATSRAGQKNSFQQELDSTNSTVPSVSSVPSVDLSPTPQSTFNGQNRVSCITDEDCGPIGSCIPVTNCPPCSEDSPDFPNNCTCVTENICVDKLE